MNLEQIEEHRRSATDKALLTHQCKTIPRRSAAPARSRLRGPHLRGVRPLAARACAACSRCSAPAGWRGTGYVSILPVDQGIEHSAGASFAPNPVYFDSENIVKLAIEGGCNAVASTLGVLGSVARKYAHRIPFIVKLNHNEFLSYPNSYDQILFASVKQAWTWARWASARRSTSGPRSRSGRSSEVSELFQQAHELGLFTVLWCYTRNTAFKTKDVDYHLSADLTGQANHLGVTIEADIIKQKLPENNGGYNAVNFGKTHKLVYSQLTSDNPIDLTRYQLANCYMGRMGPHQLGRCVVGRERSQGSGEDRRHQQARRRHGPHLGPQGVPAADEGRRGAAQRHSGRLPRQRNHRRVARREGRLQAALALGSS